ncbi:DUF3120 domain-containing protein [cyanobacterium endosymbiont of Rhopalodia gibberula]|uniref:DUF3120 domain-containing protein n=1 Tax=cyanobacterium endosymbiont of Rhopalodia gibberula TaxID=1763363 RepID=UPI001E47DE2E|nr:DUF3120 domain-containing protein [cyanobacterium endosymbiont of Rhopalodia gibberula]
MYWVWSRWESLVHPPIESIGVPVVIWGLCHGWGNIKNLFYLKSLLGMGIADFYFCMTVLISD